MILVTGGAGYIGSHIIASLRLGEQVVILDDFSNAEFSIIDKINSLRASKVKVVHGSVTDPGAVEYAFNQGKIKTVIHCAGLKSIADSNNNKLAYTKTNVDGTSNVMEQAIASYVKTFIFSSSAAVYAPPKGTDFKSLDENSPVGPISHYGLTKLRAEEKIFKLVANYNSDMRVCALRYFNPVGALPFLDRSTSNLVPALCAASASGDPLKVFGTGYPTPDGSCVRDFIPISLLARLHSEAISNPRFTGILNVGLNSGKSVLEMHKIWMDATKVYVDLKELPPREGDVPYLVADNTKLRTIIKSMRSYDARRIYKSLVDHNELHQKNHLKFLLRSQWEAF
jgi:UDP-glucose 4-epimerase